MKRVKNTISKTLAMLLAVLMIVSMLPVTAVATEPEYVYISVSYDGKYINDKNGGYIAYIPVPMETVAAINLDDYELSDYWYDEDGDGTYETTALQLIIYAHENIYGGSWSDVNFTGSPGSSYFQGGIFGFDENLNYYLNGEYPLAGEGWGATSDQIMLEAGDFIDIGSFSSWDFYQDSNYGFHFFADESGAFIHDYTVEAGNACSVKLVRSYSGMGTGAIVYDANDYTVYYGTSYGDATGSVTTDDSGCAEVTFPSAGTWYLWADGGYGLEFSGSVVSAPAFATVNVKAAEVAVTGITLDKSTATLEVGDTLTLNATVLPDEAADETVTWTSDDETVAKIAGGVVTAMAAGEAKITAKAGDQEASCVITVAAAPINVSVTIADKGKVVVANNEITVTDLDASGDFNVDEVLYAAHKSKYTDGAAAGYASAMGNYGLYITKLWGNESGNYGYWLNDASCRSLGDTVKAEDSLVAFVYQNTEVWDSYAKFANDTYTIAAEVAGPVTLQKAGYDSDWNTVFTAHKGATLKVYDSDFNELAANEYKVADNGDGTYDVTVKAVGNYTIVAYDNVTPIVPALCTLTVANNADIAPANAVEEKITAIGEVTLESEDKIEAARAAYENLTPAQKALVENYADLEAAEAEFDELKAEAKTAADKVEDLIDAIDNVTIHSCNIIKAAREAYNALSAAEQEFVENYATLTTAESAISALYAEAAKADHKAIYESTGKYIKSLGTPSVGSTGGEWMVIGLTRSGYSCPEGYYKNVIEYVEAEINELEQLHKSKSTDNSRVILGLTSAGYDVTNVGGHNLLMGLTDMSYVKKQGINGPIWALIAFDCHNYDIPTNTKASEQVTRDKLIDTILAAQHDDGGWSLSANKTAASDPDITGMAIQALAPYYETNAKAKAAVDEALTCLSQMQYDNGGFGSVDGACSESCAQVIVALTALGLNPETDNRFVKNGVSVVDAMCLFAVKDGGFAHVPNGGRNGMATEQRYYALTAYYRMLEKKTTLYDMTDVTIMSTVKTVETLIDAIGKVTVDSGDIIKAARAAYDSLSAADKKKVANLDTLEDAEEAYDELTVVKNVIDLIDAIGTVTINSETRIVKARAAYNNLTAAQKKLVSNYYYLLYAEEELEEAKVEYVEDLISSIGTVTKDSKTKIDRARTAYNNLSAANKKEVSNLSVLTAAEEAYKKLAETPDSNKTTTTTTTVKDLTVFAGKVDEQIENIADDATTGEILDVILAYETLTEAEKAAIGKKQTVEFMKKQIAEMLQTDSKTGIGASGMDWNIQVVVSDPLDVTKVQEMQEKLGDNTMLGLWDIHLSDVLLSREVQPDGSVLIKIPLALLGDYTSYDGLAVVHYADDGTVEYLNSTVIGDCIAFNTVEFSYFAVVGYEGMSPLDNSSNDASAPVIPWVIAGCCALALCAVVVFLIRKNKKELVGKYAE